MAERLDRDTPLDLRKFDDVLRRQYEWQIADGGEIWGLVAGDQGYDQTGITIDELVGEALCAVTDEGRETKQWPLYTELQDALDNLIKVSRKILPQ